MMSKNKVMIKYILLGSVLAILIFSSSVTNPMLANGEEEEEEEDDDDDGVSDDEEKQNERNLSVEVSDKEAQITSRHDYGDIQNEISVQMKAESDSLTFEVSFDNESHIGETEIEFSVEFSNIIEYDDIHDDGFFNESIDSIVQEVELTDFDDIIYSLDNISNNLVHHLEIQTADSVFSASIYISSEFSIVNDILISPTEMKIDIGIHGFSYDQLDTNLALQIELESEEEVDYEEEEETEDEEDGRASDEEGINIILGDYTGFFTWIENATVDGVIEKVKTTPLVSGEKNTMYLNYPRGNEIIHDPKIGIGNILLENITSIIVDIPWLELEDMSKFQLAIVSGSVFVLLTTFVIVYSWRYRRKENL